MIASEPTNFALDQSFSTRVQRPSVIYVELSVESIDSNKNQPFIFDDFQKNWLQLHKSYVNLTLSK